MRIVYILVLCFCFEQILAQEVSHKQRVVVLTDIENEPDDTQSFVRFLTFSNQYDIEGIIATTSVHQKNKIASWKLREIVSAYGKVQANLNLHQPGFRDTTYFHAIIKDGYAGFGMEAVGPDKHSEGSDWLVHLFQKKDDRPLWVLVWGGPNCLAQALFQLEKEYSKKEVERIVSKLRVYTISDQDDSGPWIRKTFPSLFYICSPGTQDKGAYHYATWTGISGDRFNGRFSGANFSIVDNSWLDQHIRIKGPLGALYPKTKYLMEGDTPSFLYLFPNGLGDPEHPNYGSWGGRYEYYTPRYRKWFYEAEQRPIWTDVEDEVLGIDSLYQTSNKATIWRWREAYQHEFAARMDWTIMPYNKANHPPVALLDHSNTICVKMGDTVRLSASHSTDPDGDVLDFNWIYYREVGSFEFKSTLKLFDAAKSTCFFVAPRVSTEENIHIILAVTDKGTPSLTRYQRIVVTVYP